MLLKAKSITGAALLAILLAFLATCGGNGGKGSPQAVPGTGTLEAAPATTPVSEVLAELDAMEAPAGVEAEVFSRLKRELALQLRAANSTSVVSTPPAGDSNRVTDLMALDNGDSTYDVVWHYRNVGDYDQNGAVSISDLTPLAQNFGAEVTGGELSLLSVVDGDGNGTIGISDVTPIAQNFGVQCAAYSIQTAPAEDGPFTEVDTIPQSEGTGAGRLEYRRTLALTAGEWVQVVPVDAAPVEGTPSDPELVAEWHDDFTYDVTYTSDTTYIDESHLNLLIDADTETHTYVFDAQGVADAGLELTPGRIMLLHGIALETVVDAQTVGDDLIIEGEDAYITDAIEEGTIGWDYGVNFTPDKIPSMLIDGKQVFADGDGVIEYEFPWGDYTYAIKVELQDAYAAMEFTISKDIGGGLGVKMVLEGNLERFRVDDLIEIRGQQLESFNHNYEKMKGQGSISLIAAGSIQDTMTLVDLPAPLLIIPFTVGPVPVVLTIEAKFLVEVVVPPIDGSSRVTVSFSYDSDLGFNYDGVSVHNTGSLGSHSFNDEVTETGGSSALGVNFGVAFPRVKLSAFWGKIVPWAHIQFVIGGTWDPIAPCQTADYEIRGVGDVDFTLFNLSSVVGDLTFFHQTEELLRAGD